MVPTCLVTLQAERIILSCTKCRLLVPIFGFGLTTKTTMSYMVQTLVVAQRVSLSRPLILLETAESNRRGLILLANTRFRARPNFSLSKLPFLTDGAVRSRNAGSLVDRCLNIPELFLLYLVSSHLCKSRLLRNRRYRHHSRACKCPSLRLCLRICPFCPSRISVTSKQCKSVSCGDLCLDNRHLFVSVLKTRKYLAIVFGLLRIAIDLKTDFSTRTMGLANSSVEQWVRRVTAHDRTSTPYKHVSSMSKWSCLPSNMLLTWNHVRLLWLARSFTCSPWG